MPPTPSSAAGIQDAARHLAEGRPTEAAAVLERLVVEFPAYVTAYVLLAKAYEASGSDGEALEAWHHAYFLMPGSPLVIRERTRLLRTAPVTAADRTVGGEQLPLGDAPSEPDNAREAPPEESSEEREAPEEPSAEVEVEAEDEAEVEADEPALASEIEPQTDARAEEAPDDDPLDAVDDLDSLIHQLENAPRIRPDPDFRDEGYEDEDEEEGLVSETLARIYATQKQYAAAARAYEQLAELYPDRAAEFEAKAAEMDGLASPGS